MNTQDVIKFASQYLEHLSGHTFKLLYLNKPKSPEAAVNLAKIISKLSPFLGNLIEFDTVELLNQQDIFSDLGKWERQDPGFPDTIFRSEIKPIPGLEIKAWFPLATEITARFKDSQNHFQFDQTHVVLIAWLPEFIIYGRPKIIGVCVISGLSIAQARDNHYHKPPDYLVLEPEDTTTRTVNLQQTNTNGYKFQGSKQDLSEAKKIVQSWGNSGKPYRPTREYQECLRQLTTRFKYRLDTNFAKLDRIVHPEIEKLKKNIYEISFQGITISQWNKLLASHNEERIKSSIEQYLDIKKENLDKPLDEIF